MANPTDITLGCAEEYEVIVVARDLQTYAARLNWSNLSWSRVLDGISDARVTVPDSFGGLRCNIELGEALVPWKFGIRIECNGELVWTGPITSITRPTRDGAGSDHIEITASDSMAWTQRRTASNYQNYVGIDAGTMFKGVLEDAMNPDNLPGLLCPTFATSYLMTREVVPLDFEYSFDVLSELANSAVDYFMLGSELVVYDTVDFGWFVQRNGVKQRVARTDDPFGRYIYGLFTDGAYLNRPGFTIDGFAQANNVYVPGADSGEAGFRRWWNASDVSLVDGLLTYVDVSALYRPQSGDPISIDYVFQQQADSILALRKNAIVVLSGGDLSQSAPVTRSGLLPGSLWAIDLGEVGIAGLVDVQRLKRVDVDVSVGQGGITERVSPTLIPIGSDETVLG